MTDPDAWIQERLAAEVEFAVSPMGRLRREDREVAFALEIQRLRAGLQAMLDEEYPHPRSNRPGKCPHGIYYYEECGNCIDSWLTRVLSGTEGS